MYFSPSSPTLCYYSIPCDFFDLLSTLILVIFVNIISLHEIDHFYHPLDNDSLIVVGSKFAYFSMSSVSIFSQHDVFLSPHLYLSEEVLYDLISSIFDLSVDDHSYLPILKQFEVGSHMHVGGLVEIDISDDPKYPKIFYISDILTKSKWEITNSILIECQTIFTFGYKDMLGLDPNLIMHNIITYLDAKPNKQKSYKFIPT